MRRSLPNLLNSYLKVGPKPHLIRTEHSDNNCPSPIKNQLTKVKTRHPSSFFQLPILDSVVSSPTVPLSPPDRVLEAVKSANSIKEIFEIVLKEEKNLEENHLTKFFRLILQFQNNSRTCYSSDALQNHIGFIKLCQRLLRVAPNMTDPANLVACLKTLVFCQVAGESRIIQTLLHLLKSKVNDLGLQQVIFLDFLLRKIKSPLADALVIALPVVFQTQLETQLNADNIKTMCDSLRYAIDRRASAPKVKFIADSLLSSSNKWENSEICSVIWSLSKIRYLPDHGILPLLENALDQLAKRVNRIERKDLERTLVAVGENYTGKSQYWYHEELCNAIAKRVVQEQWPLSSTSPIGRTFAKLSYVNFEFLDYYSSLIATTDEKLTMHPHYLLAPFAVANYRTPTFEKMVEQLLKYSADNMVVNKYQQWFRFAIDCATLGFYPRSLISQIFEESFVNSHFGKQASHLDWLQLDVLNRSVRLECPEYDGPYPTRAITERCHRKIYEANVHKEQFVSVEKALQSGVGGLSYVTTGLLTKHGHFVDHVIAMRPGGYPVAINTASHDPDTIRYVEDLDGTNGCQLLLIKIFRSNAYVINGDRLRGIYDLELRTLERTGYDIVPVNLGKWEALQDYEKIPFLMQQVRLKEKALTL